MDGAGYGICPLAMSIRTLNSKNTPESTELSTAT